MNVGSFATLAAMRRASSLVRRFITERRLSQGADDDPQRALLVVQLPAIVDEIQELPAAAAIIDGEAMILDDKGVSHLGSLQQVFTKAGGKSRDAVLYAFDLLYLDGVDLRRERQRLSALRQRLAANIVAIERQKIESMRLEARLRPCPRRPPPARKVPKRSRQGERRPSLIAASSQGGP